jgi:hypothetical protein
MKRDSTTTKNEERSMKKKQRLEHNEAVNSNKRIANRVKEEDMVK